MPDPTIQNPAVVAPTIPAGGASDTVAAAGGADTVAAAGGADTQAGGGAKDNSLIGGEETAQGAAGDDTLKGGQGDAPTVPDRYDLKAPEGITLDNDLMEAVAPTLKDLGLTNDQAQKLADTYTGTVLPRVVEQVVNQVAEANAAAWAAEQGKLQEAFRRDPVIGGTPEQVTEKLGIMGKGIDVLAGVRGTPDGEAFRSMLTRTGAGNTPEMGRFLYKLGQSLAEGRTLVGGAGAQVRNMSPEEKFYGSEFLPPSQRG